MKDEILEYLRKHVTTWPDDADGVWLCYDGEIVFDSLSEFDFYPDEPFEGVFKADEEYEHCSETYTREQWETDLTKLDKPFGELDRATQLKLVEHVLDGGRVECTAFGNINGMFRELKTLGTGHCPLFQNNYTYRAIQP